MVDKVAEEPTLEDELEDELDDDEEDEEEESLEQVVSREVASLEERIARRLARKPDVSKLEPAVHFGVPAFDKGTRVVVERRITFLPGNPWLDTKLYTVLHVDLSSGLVQALDDEAGHRSFLSFTDGHHDFYLVPKRGNPLAKKRRRRFVQDAEG